MHRLVIAAGALAALVVGIVQLRHGIVPLLDTVTYWSGAEAVANGHFFSTSLAPSFSNFSALQFLERSGSLPFVDFPVGYPLLAGSLGTVMGVKHAMQGLVLMALVAIVVGIVVGGSSMPRRWQHSTLLALTGVLVTLTPAMRLVTQGALSEPLFAASVLWLVVILARYRRGGAWAPIPGLVVAASLLRFLGAPLAVLAGWERYRRTGRRLEAAMWTVGMMIPAALNIGFAAAAGGGHSAGWRGIDRLDVETFVRSIGGWFDSRQGDIRRTYFTNDGPSWWSWPVALGWLLLIVFAVLATLRLGARRSPTLPAESELALTAAGIMSIGLIAGIMGFDALVIADNRLMLPSGLLTIAALAWWSNSPRVSLRMMALAPALVVVWAFAAVRPWQVGDLFSDQMDDSPLVIRVESVARERGQDPTIVITNDADRVHWETGLPAAYSPMPVKPLTGESVDEISLYNGLPCALLDAGGVIVISNEATFSSVNRDLLDAAVERGTLDAVDDGSTTVYRPTSTACDTRPD